MEKNQDLYLQVRRKITQLQEQVHFECKRCKDTCCSGNVDRFPLLQEDLNLLKRNRMSVEGIKMYETGQMHLRRGKHTRDCHYYDLQGRACRIHGFKPLFCLSYPFNFDYGDIKLLQASVEEVRDVFFPNPSCKWVKENSAGNDLDEELLSELKRLFQELNSPL